MSVKILIGDALERLRELEDQSVHCVVTSPPYWGLRDYGTATWEGGDPECNHVGEKSRTVSGGGGKQYTNKGSNRVFSGDCHCGARRRDAQLGLEKTPDEHCAAMVEVFREVKRVLRDDATLWLNYGDSYCAQPSGSKTVESKLKNAGFNFNRNTLNDAHTQARIDAANSARGRYKTPPGLKPKDLVGMPWRVAFALQADGWYLRSDIIWHKPNPMPEPVTDRPTKSHEHLFLMTKSAKYFYDADAVREPHQDKDGIERFASHRGINRDDYLSNTQGWNAGSKGMIHRHRNYHSAGRNLRDVWTIATHSFPGAHFATFPPKLVEPCIKAGCPEDGTVLDPFGGAGTVGLVADRLDRDAILIELNEEYARMARKRIYDDCPMFTHAEVVGGNGL